MVVVDSICQVLAQIAPLRLAESWDNVGLLVGNRQQAVNRAMTCLTISPDVVDEAIEAKVDLIVVHHPLPFKSLQRITSDTIVGTMLLRLIASNVAIYMPIPRLTPLMMGSIKCGQTGLDWSRSNH